MTIPDAFDLALQRHQEGRLADAEAIYRQILAAQPNHADTLHMLGILAHQTGRQHTEDLIHQAIAINPAGLHYHISLGNVLSAQGRTDDAIAGYRHVLRIDPNSVDAHYNLGIALQHQGHLEEAASAYRAALQLKPDFAAAHNNLGTTLKAMGRIEEAVLAYRRALEIKPDSADAHNNLGVALGEDCQFAEAAEACRHALRIDPSYADAWYNLGNASQNQGRLDAAIGAYRCALQLKPDFPLAHNNLGNALRDRGQLDEAIAAYRRGLELKPEDANTHSNLVFTLHYYPGHDQQTIAEERRRWNRQFGDPLKPFIRPHTNDRRPDRRLRIGYVSPDFRDHVVGRNLIPLFQHHDRQSFEILCYSEVLRPDSMTEEFRGLSQQWSNTAGMGDEPLAKRIRQDGVDILVDLSQHTAGNRLPMFARKPAPIQVSFAGYPESAGLEAIEYRISDRYLEPGVADEGTGSLEHVCLMDSFWCYDPCGADVEVSELPSRESARVTFGCLNNFCKVSEQTLRLWALALGKLADSRLILLSRVGSHRERTLEALGSAGVEAHRVEFVDFCPRREYLELYHRVDIALDTFPYNGHTTSLDALWMGVPVVSLAGATPVSRAGLSQLTNLGLPELVAHSEEHYARIAAELAGDRRRLAHLRSILRDRMKSSILMDAPRFARQVERAYREMWEGWVGERAQFPKE